MTSESDTSVPDPTDAQLARVSFAIAIVMGLALSGAHWWSYGRPLVQAEDARVCDDVAIHATNTTGRERPTSTATPPSELWIDATFSEAQHWRLHVGQAVEIRTDADPQRLFTGHLVDLAAPEVFPGQAWYAATRVHARISLDGGNGNLHRLRAGMPVSAAVDTRSP